MKRQAFDRVEFVEDHPFPSKMRDDTIYIEGDGKTLGKVFYAFLLCPCGCTNKSGDRTLIALPLYNEKKICSPSWQISSLDPVTLSPSIHQIRGCKSHFFIQQNRVKWV